MRSKGEIKLRLKKKEAEALKQLESTFLRVFEMNKNDEDSSDTLDWALHDMKDYLIIRGLLEENEEE